MRQIICFDLDGTLTDPAEGFTRSIQYACSRLGLPIPDREELLPCIGPPIQQTFANLLQTEDAQAIQSAVALYRERYSAQGLLENAVYPGVETMLRQLNAMGKRLYVATSKPTPFAVRILRHFALDTQFVGIYGSELDGTRSHKAEVIAYLLAREQFTPSEAAMIGDRKHDMLGARQHGLYAAGVTYGYGDCTELQEAGAEVLCHTPGEVTALFCRE
ncbi:MAG TPA: HAD family hydrolase [Chthonomonadaceae bacterium]|nr:HAD family hydrolase [Chthonomonadaceae bacterium]